MTWVDLPEGTGFGLDNLPLGIFSTDGGTPRTGVRIGDCGGKAGRWGD